MLNEALNYLKLGWSIIPCCWAVDGKCGCGRGHEGNQIGKSPFLPTWKDYQSRLPTTAEVTRWWTDAPQANIACITGAISKMAVVDLEYEGLEEAKRLGLHSGLISQTGKGKHLIYRHPGGKVCGTTKFNGVRGLDIRGDGNYIILPPSRHISGRKYRWLTPVFGAGAFSIFPEKIFASSAKSLSETVSNKPKDWISEALGGLGNGNRNSTFASVVGRLHGQRWSSGDIRALLLPHAMRVEFPESELDSVIRSVARYPVTVRGGLQSGVAGAEVSGGERPKLVTHTLDSNWDEYRARRDGIKLSEYSTGYRKLDNLIGGGLQPEELFALAGWTGTGKTNWLLGLCRSLCVRGKRVLMLSTEMSRRKIWDRYIALSGSEADARGHSLYVSDEFIPNPEAIRAAIVEMKADVFVFDHIHNVSEQHDQVGEYIRKLKQYALEFKIPGVVACQFNKTADWTDPKTGKRMAPRLSQIKGSASIIETAAQILLLDEQDDTPEGKDILGVLDKNRDGEKGLVQFVLRKHPYRMEEQ